MKEKTIIIILIVAFIFLLISVGYSFYELGYINGQIDALDYTIKLIIGGEL